MKILLFVSITLNIINAVAVWSDDSENYDPCGEYYHWEANQVNPFADTKVIIDPYSD